MIVTKEQQEALVNKYVKEKHNQDECIGFIDGLDAALELVKNLTIPYDTQQRKQLIDTLKCIHAHWDVEFDDLENTADYIIAKIK